MVSSRGSTGRSRDYYQQQYHQQQQPYNHQQQQYQQSHAPLQQTLRFKKDTPSILSDNTVYTGIIHRDYARQWSRSQRKCPHSDWTIHIVNPQTGRRDTYYIHTKALDSLPDHRSPYFEPIFTEKLKHVGNQESELIINDDTVAEGFGIFLDFLYATSANEEESLLNNVKRGMIIFGYANYFQVLALKRMLATFYRRNTSALIQDTPPSSTASSSMPKLFQKRSSQCYRDPPPEPESPMDAFARSMATIKYIDDAQLQLEYFIQVLERRKQLNITSSTAESKNISCLVAMCAEHNRKSLTRRLFYKLTHKDYIPHINQQAALKLLTIEEGCRFCATKNIPSSTLPRVMLKRNRQSKSFREGNQIVFDKSIAYIPVTVATSDLVQVEVPKAEKESTKSKSEARTQLLGWGVYNPNSLYRVRILGHARSGLMLPSDSSPHQSMRFLLSRQLQKAIKTRQNLGLPSTVTNTYRLVNGEGDGLSGLAIDVVGGKVAVVMSSAIWCEDYRELLTDAIQELIPGVEVVWKSNRPRLEQDGLASGAPFDRSSLIAPGAEDSPPIVAMENEILYETFPHRPGQKTSVYCDQRENRHYVSQFCRGKRVLDLCCYNGGFALNAAKQGAARVLGVDSSEAAIASSQRNAELNGLSQSVEFVEADIAEFMQSCKEKFDVIVLDPPKLAPNAQSLSKASRKYQSLNREAIKLVDDTGGLLMTCTCSSKMAQEAGGNFFLQLVQEAGNAANREVSLLRVNGAASCHTQSPMTFPSGNYLTAAMFQVHPKT
eukprot:Nitzschia sp. Nitz4//scaffold30_size153850//612//3638//NITZ4_002754-RA/size153850-augustus-gene-0.64-mRNA-1//-1//CDS//3329547190//7275//frame0